MVDNILFTCYQKNLKDYLLNNGCRYSVVGLSPSNNKYFWVFIKDEKVKECLVKWKNRESVTGE